MTYRQKLAKIDRKHILSCYAILVAFYFLCALIAYLVFFSHQDHNMREWLERIALSLIPFAIMSMIFFVAKESIVHFYLAQKGLAYQEDASCLPELTLLARSLLHKRGVIFKNNKNETVKIHCKFIEGLICQVNLHIVSTIQGAVSINIVPLTKEESSLIILALAPRGGTFSFDFASDLEISLVIKPLSGHEQMAFQKYYQNISS